MTRLHLVIAVIFGFAHPAVAQGLIRDAEIEQTLAMLALPIYKAANVDPSTVEIYIVNNDSINAFVAGGKNIFLNTGLIQNLKTVPELQGVIAHELGHITGNHIQRRSIKLRNARGPALLGHLVGIAASVAGSGEAGTAIVAGSQGALLRDVLRHSRSEEATADQAALTYLDRAGIDPSGLHRVFEQFRRQGFFSDKINPYAATHPFYKQRMQLIERRVRDAEFKSDPSPEEHVYRHTRMRAKLDGFLNDPERTLTKLDTEPETEFTLYAKAVALHRIASLQKAIALMNKLISMRPNDPYYIELKGQILFESGQVEDAIPLYRRAIQLASDEPLLKAGLGRALLALNTDASDTEALIILQDARRIDMADAAALRDLAVAYSRAGDYGMASLSTAERLALQGRNKDAVVQARRASSILPEGSPGWFRAQDILSLALEERPQ